MKDLWKNIWIRYVVILLIGMGIGAVFYPSKSTVSEDIYKYKEEISRLEQEKVNIQKEYVDLFNRSEKENKEYRERATHQIISLRAENYKLKSKVKESKFKLVKPDGTIEERWFKESETDVVSSVVTKIRSEFDQKIVSIENKWKKVHEQRTQKIRSDYEKKIAEFKSKESSTISKKKVDTNKRSFGLSLGITSEKDYFSSATYDIYGPFFLDLHLGSDRQFQDKEVGIGLGIRF